MAKKLTDAQRRALVHAKDNGSVDDRMFRYETISALVELGFLGPGERFVWKLTQTAKTIERHFGYRHTLTPAGRAALMRNLV